MRPSDVLELKRDQLRDAATRFRATNLRVFGSALRGADSDGSDIDLLVDVPPGTTLFELGGLQVELEFLLGVRVDLLTPGDLSPRCGKECWPRPVRFDGQPPRRLSAPHARRRD